MNIYTVAGKNSEIFFDEEQITTALFETYDSRYPLKAYLRTGEIIELNTYDDYSRNAIDIEYAFRFSPLLAMGRILKEMAAKK